jgi:hypothetical protein
VPNRPNDRRPMMAAEQARTVRTATRDEPDAGPAPVSGRLGPVARRIGAALATFYRRAGRVDRRCYGIAVVLVASGFFHLIMQFVIGGPWDGPVSWRKPTTFGLAFGLTLATITWVTTFVPMRDRTRGRALAVFAAACVVEVTVITVQAWRGVPSHFNVTTPLNSAFAYSAAVGGAVIIIATLVFVSAVPRRDRTIPPSVLLAVRAGFAAFLVALAIGALMIFLGVRETRTVSQAAAYTVGAAFKSGHAATMHGILILPVLAWLTSFVDWPEARRVRIVALGCAGYCLAAGVVVVDTFIAVDPLAPLDAPLITSVLAGGGILALLSAGVLTLHGLRTAPARTGIEHV